MKKFRTQIEICIERHFLLSAIRIGSEKAGLSDKTALFGPWQAKQKILMPLLDNFAGVLKLEGSDRAIRPLVGGFQLSVMEALAALIQKGKVADVQVIYHAPQPPAELCAPAGEFNLALVSPEIVPGDVRWDHLEKLSKAVRLLLDVGGRISVVRSGESREKLNSDVASRIREYRVSDDRFPEDMQGVTIMARDVTGKEVVCFSAELSQPGETVSRTWKMWYGSVQEEGVQARMAHLKAFLEPLGIQLMPELPKVASVVPPVPRSAI